MVTVDVTIVHQTVTAAVCLVGGITFSFNKSGVFGSCILPLKSGLPGLFRGDEVLYEGGYEYQGEKRRIDVCHEVGFRVCIVRKDGLEQAAKRLNNDPSGKIRTLAKNCEAVQRKTVVKSRMMPSVWRANPLTNGFELDLGR